MHSPWLIPHPCDSWNCPCWTAHGQIDDSLPTVTNHKSIILSPVASNDVHNEDLWKQVTCDNTSLGSRDVGELQNKYVYCS